MATWMQEYLSALEVRDEREQAQRKFIDTYSKLADRTAGLEERLLKYDAGNVSPVTSPPRPSTPSRGSPLRGKAASPLAAEPEILSRLRSELAATQRTRATLETQVRALTESLEASKAQGLRDSRALAEGSRANAALDRKVRDRDDEIKSKADMVRKVQDEMIMQELTLNMLEKRKAELEAENGELVRRWMKRMGKEVDDMNREHKWE